MKGKSVGILLSVGVALIIGIVLVTIIAEQTITKTQLKWQSETVDISTTRLGSNIDPAVILTLDTGVGNWRNGYSECIPSSINYYNQSGSILADATDYVYTAATGTFHLEDTDIINQTDSNTTIASYLYCPDDYLAEGWSRTVSNMVPGFFALAILLGTVYVIFHVLKEEGVTLNQNN